MQSMTAVRESHVQQGLVTRELALFSGRFILSDNTMRAILMRVHRVSRMHAASLDELRALVAMYPEFFMGLQEMRVSAAGAAAVAAGKELQTSDIEEHFHLSIITPFQRAMLRRLYCQRGSSRQCGVTASPSDSSLSRQADNLHIKVHVQLYTHIPPAALALFRSTSREGQAAAVRTCWVLPAASPQRHTPLHQIILYIKL